jgi:hypothetical protein
MTLSGCARATRASDRRAVERGDIDLNLCKQVERNLERPRTEAQDAATFVIFIAWFDIQGATQHKTQYGALA